MAFRLQTEESAAFGRRTAINGPKNRHQDVTKLRGGVRRLTWGKADLTMYNWDVSSNAERLVALLLVVAIVVAFAA